MRDSHGWEPTWREWLFQQVDREDTVGSFARMIKSRSCCSRKENPFTLNRHLWAAHWRTPEGRVLKRLLGGTNLLEKNGNKARDEWAKVARSR